MNNKLSKSNIKGREEILLTISPSDNLEREFFNALFSGADVEFTKVANSEDIVVSKKGLPMGLPIIPEKLPEQVPVILAKS